MMFEFATTAGRFVAGRLELQTAMADTAQVWAALGRHGVL